MEAVVEKRKRNQWNSTFDHQCKETKTIYKTGIVNMERKKAIQKLTNEMNFLRQRKREANVKRMNSANQRQEQKETTKVVRRAKKI